MDRRTLLKGAIGSGALLVSGTTCWSRPVPPLAGRTIKAAFGTVSEPEVLNMLFGGVRAKPSSRVTVMAPFVTSPALAATVKVISSLDGARAIALTIKQAEHPLAAFVRLSGAPCFFSTRIQMEQTSPVSAYVLTDSGVFGTSTRVKVTQGGHGIT